MSDLFPDEPIDLHQQIECVKREIRMRESVYPRWVEKGRMKPEKAEHEIKAMKAVLATLETRRGADPITEDGQQWQHLTLLFGDLVTLGDFRHERTDAAAVIGWPEGQQYQAAVVWRRGQRDDQS